MAELYHDGTRKTLFADRSRQLGPLSGAEFCAIDLLEWSPGTPLVSCAYNSLSCSYEL